MRLSFRRSAVQGWACLVVLIALTLAVVATACGGNGDDAVTADGDRTTVSLALMDDASRRAALYAIQQGIVTSNTVDIDLTYLPLSTIVETVLTKQYEVIEAAPLAVPRGLGQGIDLVILSAGLHNLDGTFLFVPNDSEIDGPNDLRRKNVGVAPFLGAFALETRYLLQETYGLTASPEGRDVTITSWPAESLLTVLGDGRADATVIRDLGAFRLLEDESFRLISHVAKEVRDIAGAPIMHSILVTYPDVAEQKAGALSELNGMLAESLAYFKANKDQIVEAVAADQDVDAEFLRWWWERYDLPLGDRSVEMQERLLHAWEAAKVIGEIEGYPDLERVLFDPHATTPASD